MVSSALSIGVHNLIVTQTDASENVSDEVNAGSVDVKVPTPAAPTVTSTSLNIDKTATVTGSGQTGATVNLFADGILDGSAVVTSEGTYSVTTSAPFSAGTYKLSVSQTVNDATSASVDAGSITVVSPTTSAAAFTTRPLTTAAAPSTAVGATIPAVQTTTAGQGTTQAMTSSAIRTSTTSFTPVPGYLGQVGANRHEKNAVMGLDSTGDNFYFGFATESSSILGQSGSGFPDVMITKIGRINTSDVLWANRLKVSNDNDEMYIWTLQARNDRILVSGYVDRVGSFLWTRSHDAASDRL